MGKQFLKISIVTPSFNQGEFIERTIQSVLNQNYPNLEYIIIDGGSTDNTLEILKKYKEQIIYISEPDRGQADAVNKGFKMCTGEIIGWLNSDDTYAPGILDKINEFFLNNENVSMVYGECNQIDENDNLIGREDVIDFNYDILKRERCYIPQMTVFFRKEIIDKLGYLDTMYKYSMDYEFWLRISQNFKVQKLSFSIANFRIHPKSKSSQKSFSQFKENLQIKYKYNGISKIRFFLELYLWRLMKFCKNIKIFLVYKNYNKLKQILEIFEIVRNWYSYIFVRKLIIVLSGKELAGCHLPSERELLQKYASGRRKLVEIGVFDGVSSLVIRKSMSPDGTLYLIDPYIPDSMNKKIRGNYILARLYVARSKNGKVVWLKDFSYNIAHHWTESIDFLFVDGDHREEACLRDWLDWSPFVVKGGVVLFHDARAEITINGKSLGWPGPTKVVNRLFREEKIDGWEIIDEQDTIVVVKKL